MAFVIGMTKSCLLMNEAGHSDRGTCFTQPRVTMNGSHAKALDLLLYNCATQHYCLLTVGAVKIKSGPFWF